MQEESVDLLLHPFLQATEESASHDLLAELIHRHADPVIRRLLRAKLQVSFYGAGHQANHPEADDLYGEVITQLLVDLRACKQHPSEKPIHHLPGFVARLTLNACYKHWRNKYPRRHSLKNKVRYLLTHQPGFALWERADQGLLCGYAAWQKQTQLHSPKLQELFDHPQQFVSQAFPQQAVQRVNPAELVAAIFNYVGHAFELDVLVSILAELWGVQDQYESLDESKQNGAVAELADQRADVANEVSNRLYLQRLWEEICDLPVRQRTALLLNLRDEQGNSVVPLLPTVGIASLAHIAATLELDALEFARLWYDLPLEDRRIAELLGLTRQQVINLRKSARERLARRMKGL